MYIVFNTNVVNAGVLFGRLVFDFDMHAFRFWWSTHFSSPYVSNVKLLLPNSFLSSKSVYFLIGVTHSVQVTLLIIQLLHNLGTVGVINKFKW